MNAIIKSCLLFVLFLSFSINVYGQSVSSTTCASLHGIFLRGEGTDGGPYNGVVMEPFNQLLLSSIPNSSTVAIDYDSGNPAKDYAVYNGTLMAIQYIEDYVASCPDSKLFLLGYSLGGDALMEALCGDGSWFYFPAPTLDMKYKSNIVYIAIFAEESYVSGQPYNSGNCTDGHGVRFCLFFFFFFVPGVHRIADFLSLPPVQTPLAAIRGPTFSTTSATAPINSAAGQMCFLIPQRITSISSNMARQLCKLSSKKSLHKNE